MENCTEDEDQFFDATEEMSDLRSDFSENFCSTSMLNYDVLDSFGYEFWMKNPLSVQQRRRKFLNWMGVSLDRNPSGSEELIVSSCEKHDVDMDRIVGNDGAVLRSLDSEDGFYSSQSSPSCQSNEAVEFAEDGSLGDESMCRIRNLDDGTEFIVDKYANDGLFYKLREVGSNRWLSIEEFQRALGSSPLVQQLLRKEAEDEYKSADAKKKAKLGWLKKLGILACMVDGQREFGMRHNEITQKDGALHRSVRVHSHKKRSKELSSLFAGQEFSAHKGSILTMKFSVDGRYLASGGEDGTVCVWKVIGVDRSKELDSLDTDPSNLYNTLNRLSSPPHLNGDKQKTNKMGLGRASDSASVIIPPKVFKLCEKPLHEFKGHNSEVLDLSWSSKGYLLSSSVDKTVRLWQVGCHRCLRVFPHNNYVTCVDFNPIDDNYFISGSIDGKIRIWEVLGSRVVDWTDTRDIVTAVCFRPDGKGGIVGSLNGSCRFYDITDDHLKLDAQICLQGKKKLQGKQITGFQFSPTDPTKVMITSADSVVRILSGVDVICKFKGLRTAGSQISASFTSDGRHIVSATEDSNVHVWNYTSQDKTSNRAKKKCCSYESFVSKNAFIALPWSGMKVEPDIVPSTAHTESLLGSTPENHQGHNLSDETSHNEMPFSSLDCLSLGRGFLLDLLSKGAATWPEEKLKSLSPRALSPLMRKSEYKMLKSACQNMFSSPHLWGLVIVTAGWDGRIRTFLNYGLPIRL